MERLADLHAAEAKPPSRILVHHAGLLACLALGGLIAAVLPDSLRVSTRILLAWNAAVLTFMVIIATMILRAPRCTIRQHYAAHREGRFGVLAMTLLAAAAGLGAILIELSLVKQIQGVLGPAHVGLTALTVLASWSLVHVIFALHYANLYYNPTGAANERSAEHGGIDVPGNEGHPVFVDFLYFSVIIGTCCSTSDINVTSKAVRREALIHGVFSFFFNMVVLGLMMNLISGLF
jgi:uncharacterized membrane protein